MLTLLLAASGYQVRGNGAPLYWSQSRPPGTSLAELAKDEDEVFVILSMLNGRNRYGIARLTPDTTAPAKP